MHPGHMRSLSTKVRSSAIVSPPQPERLADGVGLLCRHDDDLGATITFGHESLRREDVIVSVPSVSGSERPYASPIELTR